MERPRSPDPTEAGAGTPPPPGPAGDASLAALAEDLAGALRDRLAGILRDASRVQQALAPEGIPAAPRPDVELAAAVAVARSEFARLSPAERVAVLVVTLNSAHSVARQLTDLLADAFALGCAEAGDDPLDRLDSVLDGGDAEAR